MTATTPAQLGKQMEELARITNLVEKASIKDINSILNRTAEMFAKNDIDTDAYLEILINIARRADTLAQQIYTKVHSGSAPLALDIEEYRTLYDISRECRDGVREIMVSRLAKTHGRETSSQKQKEEGVRI